MSNKVIQNLFKPIKVGDLNLPNRIVMSAMTRLRADPETNAANDLHAEYYSQRASAGLIVTEGSPPSKKSLGTLRAAGMYTPEQVKGWKKVTDAVHAKGGRIFAQLWHGGRSGHAEYSGVQPPSASGLIIRDKPPGGLGFEQPKEMTKDEIKETTEDFRKAAENAKQAGFDGIELNGANGYIIDEFLKDATNIRTDEYGGSVEKRCRFPLEIVDAVSQVFGKGRVGIKVSPVVRFQDVYDSDPVATYSHLLKQLEKRGIAYVAIVEADGSRSTHYGPGNEQLSSVRKALRPFYGGPLMLNNGFTPETAAEAIEKGEGDLASFAKLYIGNPDLVERAKNQWGYAQNDRSTIYTPGPKGYIDYPTYQQEKAAKKE